MNSLRRSRERGFTLLELLVVIAILGMLVYMVAPAALRQLGSSKQKIAAQSIERLVGVLDIYKLDVIEVPTNRESNVTMHRQMWTTVYQALAATGNEAVAR